MVLEAELHPSEPETKDGDGGGGGGGGGADKHVEDVGLGGNCSHSPCPVRGTVVPEAEAGTMEANIPSSPIEG